MINKNQQFPEVQHTNWKFNLEMDPGSFYKSLNSLNQQGKLGLFQQGIEMKKEIILHSD